MTTFRKRINILYDEARDKNFRTTRADFAAQLGVSIGKANSYIDGNGKPDFETLKLIARNKGVTVSWLVGETDERTFTVPTDCKELPIEAQGAYDMFMEFLDYKFRIKNKEEK